MRGSRPMAPSLGTGPEDVNENELTPIPRRGGLVATWTIAEGERKKIFFCVDHARGATSGFSRTLGVDFGLPPGVLLGLGMLGFDAIILTTFSLAASRLPAADLP